MPSVSSISAQRKGKLTKKMMECAEVDSDVQDQHGLLSASPALADNGSRIRVVGSRIYDSVNGKSCHQVIFLDVVRSRFVFCLISIKMRRNGATLDLKFSVSVFLQRWVYLLRKLWNKIWSKSIRDCFFSLSFFSF